MKYWWCLLHQRVETDDDACAALARLGPYDTHEAATAALESTQARTAAQDARDEADDDWGR